MLIWLFYFAGQLLHIASRANLAVTSKINGITGYGAFFKAKALPLAVRVFLTTCLYIVFSEMQPVFQSFFPGFLPQGGSVLAKAAIAGIFGYGGDSLLDKAMAKLGLDKEVPPEPQ